MTLIGVMFILIGLNNAILWLLVVPHYRGQQAEAVMFLEDRWQGRLQKCDAILAAADKADQRSHEALVELARAQDRMQDHLLAMERITTDPRVVQALR